ncbi:M48 family metalloprotease [Candidatus Micrarchaeota archaeon]|nr:M48 family metalloprotease [Candidatus Micrarchaeota archaeon]
MSSLSALKTTMMLTLALLFGFLAAIGGLILYFYGPSLGMGAGLAMVLLFVIAMTAIQFWLGPVIIKWITRMREISAQDYPQIHAMIDEICNQTRVKKPKIYLVQDASPNAFAFGRTPDDSNIAIHAGLLNVLNKDEVKAVVAHEIGHIKHWDVAVMTLASMVPLLAYYLIVLFAPRDRDRGLAGAILVFVGAIVAQFISQMLVMYLSRTREKYADAFSAVATRNPTALQTALAKIGYGVHPAPSESSRSLRAFYISDPYENPGGKSLGEEVAESESVEKIPVRADEINHAIEWERKRGGFEWFSTHPFTYKRIDALEAIKKDIQYGKISVKDV